MRSGDINGYGTIELKDGATLTADQIDVKQNGFLVNGKVNTDKTNINTTAGATYTIFGMVTNGTTPVKNALVQLCTADTVASSEPTVSATLLRKLMVRTPFPMFLLAAISLRLQKKATTILQQRLLL